MRSKSWIVSCRILYDSLNINWGYLVGPMVEPYNDDCICVCLILKIFVTNLLVCILVVICIPIPNIQWIFMKNIGKTKIFFIIINHQFCNFKNVKLNFFTIKFFFIYLFIYLFIYSLFVEKKKESYLLTTAIWQILSFANKFLVELNFFLVLGLVWIKNK